MKKFLVLLVTLFSMQFTYADGEANIKIKMNGATSDNRYFLCMDGIGCLSILSATHGKIYPVFHPIEMDNIFITDVSNDFTVSPEGLPKSCQVTVDMNKTITISGNIVKGKGQTIRIQNLHCTVS